MTRASLTTLLLLLVSTAAAAQDRPIGIGPKGGFYLSRAKVMVGILGQVPTRSAFVLEPGIEFVAGIDETTRLVFDGNVRYPIPLRGASVELFLLGGAGLRFDYFRVKEESDVGFRLNLGGGVTFGANTALQPWAGVKVYFLDEEKSDLALQGGVNFYL